LLAGNWEPSTNFFSLENAILLYHSIYLQHNVIVADVGLNSLKSI
jgi:hypothetical protein